MNELCRKSAVDVVRCLRRKEVSPLELIDLVEQRVAEIDGTVNAMPILCLDRARQQAKKIMAAHPRNPPDHYLYGLPVAVKDLNDVQGVRSTYGSFVLKDNIPERSDIMVQNLEENGAVVIGRTNTPEFGAGGNTFNEIFGATLNPWNLEKTCGGSSGGSAVALATGEVWLATGSDLAGSLRTPASFCSVVGLRPSPGRVPSGPRPITFESLGVQGPMARNVTDAALMLDAMSGRNLRDPMSLPRPLTSFINAARTGFKPKKVAFSTDLGMGLIDEEVVEICRKGAASFSQLGAEVREVELNLIKAHQIFNVLRAHLFVAYIGREFLEKNRNKLKPEVVWNIEQGLALKSEEIASAETARVQLINSVAEIFEEFDVLVCPATSVKPFDVGIRYIEKLGDKPLDNYISWLYPTFAITLTSFPAISVPCGFTLDQLPVGLQMVVPPHREDRLLGVSALFEKMHNYNHLIPINPTMPKGCCAV